MANNPTTDGFPEGDWEPTDFILNEQRQARVTALTSLDADPEEAAKAVDLGKATGTPAPLVLGDMENFQQQHKAALTAELLRNNRFLEQYAADPIAARVSNDDWGQLDAVSEALINFHHSVVGKAFDYPTALSKSSAEAVGAAFATRPGAWTEPATPALQQLKEEYPKAYGAAQAGATLFGLPVELMVRSMGAGAGAVAAPVMKAIQDVTGLPMPTVEQLMNEVLPGLIGVHVPELPRVEGAEAAPKVPLEAQVKAAEKVANSIRTASPWFPDLPPVGVDPLTDQLHAQVAKQGVDALEAAQKEIEKTTTKPRSKDLMADFSRLHTDTKIGIDPEGVRKLYGGNEGEPIEFEPDDNKLGFIPDLQRQLMMAEAHGGDVEVSAADWLGKGNPDVAKELRDYIRVRPNGMTLEEAKEGAKPTELAPETVSAATPVEALRRASGLEPEAARAFKVEPGPTEPSIIPSSAKPYEGEVVTTKKGQEFSPYLNFPLKDALKNLEIKTEGIPGELQKKFAERLGKIVGDVPVRIVKDEDMKRISPDYFGKSRTGENYSLAFYNPKTDEIYMSDRLAQGRSKVPGFAPYALLHEGSHALTIMAMKENPELRAKVVKMMNEVKETLAETDPDILKEPGHAYAFSGKNPEFEFWAQAQSDTAFQHTLSLTVASDELRDAVGLKPPEGKSLMDVFRRLLKMMMQKMLPDLPIPDTMVDVMLHLQEEFERHEVKARGLDEEGLAARPEGEGPFKTPGAIGLDKKQQQRFMEKIEKQQKEDAEFQKEQALTRAKEQQTEEWKANFKELRKKVAEDLKFRQDVAADRFFREGDLYGKKTGGIKLATAEVEPELRGQLPDKYLAADGIHPDDAAGLFGYHSGRELIGALARIENERQLEGLTPAAHFSKMVDAETQRQMEKQYGTLEKNILANVEDHVISPTQLDILHDKMLGLAMKAFGELPTSKEGLPITKENIKSWVKSEFSNSIVGSHNTTKYLAASGRDFKEIEKALLSDDYIAAYKAQQQQVFSLELANEAKKLNKEKNKFDTVSKNMLRREPPKMPSDYVKAIRGVLFRAQRGIMGIDTAQDFEALLKFAGEKFEHHGLPIAIPEFLSDPKWRKPVDEMTVSEFRGISGLVRSLYNFGRAENTIILDGQKVDRTEHIAKLVEQADNGPWKVTPVPYNAGLVRNIPEYMKWMMHKLINMASSWNKLDVGDKYGNFNRTFTYEANSAVALETTLRKIFGQELKALKSELVKLSTKVDPLFKRPSNGEFLDLTKENVQQVIHYWGDPGAREKLLKGWGVTEENALTWLTRNSEPKMWDYAEKFGKIYEKAMGKYDNMIEEVGGIPPERITLKPFIDPFGKQRPGWYQKIIYDLDEMQAPKDADGKTMPISLKLQGQAFDPITGMEDSGFYKGVNTPNGFQKRRTGYYAPLYLKMDRNVNALNSILHGVALQPWVVNTSKIFYDSSFRQAMQRALGIQFVEKLNPFLSDMAKVGPLVSRSDAIAGRVLSFFSNNMLSTLIGGAINTLEKHTLSVWLNSVGEEGVRDFHSAFAEMWKVGDLHPTMTNAEFAMEHSEILQNRMQNVIETTGGQLNELLRGASVQSKFWAFREWMIEKGAAPIGFFDLISAKPTWISEYKKSLIEQAERFPDRQPHQDLAFKVADQAVVRAHGWTAIAARPSAMRGSVLAQQFTRLYTYFNTLFQKNYEAYWRTELGAKQISEGEYQKGLVNLRKVAWILTWGSVGTAVVEQLVTPYHNKDKDSWPIRLAKDMTLGLSGTVPIVREAVHGLIEGFGVNVGFIDTQMRSLQSAVADIKQGTKMLDAQHGGKTLKDFNTIFGILTGQTNNLIGNSIKTFWDVTHRSAETPKGWGEFARDVLHGHPREKKQ